MSQAKRDWIIAIGYVAAIYATLEVARWPLAILRSHGLLRITLGIAFILSATVIVLFLIGNHASSTWRYVALIPVGGLYFWSARHIKTPEEQVHLFEYGLVGVFFLRAISHHVHEKWRTVSAAFILAVAAGWIDELLQGVLPNRHYDLNDVFLNGISAALGLFLYLICAPSKKPL